MSTLFSLSCRMLFSLLLFGLECRVSWMPFCRVGMGAFCSYLVTMILLAQPLATLMFSEMRMLSNLCCVQFPAERQSRAQLSCCQCSVMFVISTFCHNGVMEVVSFEACARRVRLDILKPFRSMCPSACVLDIKAVSVAQPGCFSFSRMSTWVSFRPWA